MDGHGGEEQALRGHAGWGLGGGDAETERLPLAVGAQPRSNGALGHTCAAACTVEHTVQRGDTLRALAVRYHTTVGSILQLNRARSEDTLLLRRTIKIPVPPAAQSSHTGSSSSSSSSPSSTTTTTSPSSASSAFGLLPLPPPIHESALDIHTCPPQRRSRGALRAGDSG